MTLGPITIEDSLQLIGLVRAAERIIDLGVIPVRVWKLLAECERHGQIEREETLLLTESAPTTVKCSLCAVWPLWNSAKAATLVTPLRG